MSNAKQRAKRQKRMREVVARFQSYVRTYDQQSEYANYADRTYIEDMLYGIGLSIDPEGYRGASGFDLFKTKLLQDGHVQPFAQGKSNE